ncbi:MAG: GtrA family protein [Clostridia bacterium]|nr:GtrA family protein [Clostridia bacterium]
METEEGKTQSGEGRRPNFLSRLILKICFGNRALAEILRFLIVGTLATLVDFVVAGVTLYIFDPSLYPNFFNVFYGGGEATVAASCVSTGVGFVFGLFVNYLLSIIFVFDEKGNSKTGKGFVVFALLSAVGLFIHVFGMWLFVDIVGWNYWIIKIMFTAIVLVYNYVTRKLIIFNKKQR